MATNAKPNLVNDGKLTIAVGASRHEKTWKHRTLLWSQLVGKLATTTRTRETQQEYFAMPVTRQAEIKDVGAFVGGSLKEGRRSAQTVVWRQVITLDADFAGAGFWDLFQLNYDGAACIYSTHKHTPDSPRLRLVMPLSRPATPDEYQALGRQVAGTLGIDLFDDTTYEPSRLMYWPSTSLDAEYLFEAQDGFWLDVDAELAKYGPGEAWRDHCLWPESGRTQSRRKAQAETQGDPLTKKGLVGAFCRTYSVEAAIAKFLPDAYIEAGPSRWTYTKGTTSAGAVEYGDGRWLFSHHGTDPISGELVNAFDLVRLHKFGEMDARTLEDTPPGRRPSFISMSDFAAADEDVRVTLGKERIEAAREDFGDGSVEEGTEWLKRLATDKHGDPLETRENIRLILRNDPLLKTGYGWNEFSQRPCVVGNLPWRRYTGGPDGEPWQDTDDAQLRLFLEKHYDISSPQLTYDALASAMMERSFHPVRGYLESLWWDGEERLDNLLIDYLGAQDTAYTRAVTRKALVAAVARVMQPGIKYDYMLMLIGGQGIGKSKLLRKLAKHWFSDSITSVQGKDACEALRGFWLIEMAELNAFKKAEVEAIKNYLTKQEDAYRESYGRRTNRYPRQCVFFGTTNDRECLKDRTGARRFWAVEVTGRRVDDLDEETVDQIWAEAQEKWKAGEKLYLEGELEKEAERHQEEHTEDDPRIGMIEEYLSKPLPVNWEEIGLYERRNYIHNRLEIEGPKQPRLKTCALEIWSELFEGDLKTMPQWTSRQIKDSLRKVPGWKKSSSTLRFGFLYGTQRAWVKS